MSFTSVALVMALLGTCVQAYWRLRTIRDVERDLADHFGAVRALIEEVPWWRPLLRLRRQRDVFDALGQQPDEVFTYRRVYWELAGWVLLVAASLFALIGSIA